MRIQDRSRWAVRVTIAACLTALYLASCKGLWGSIRSAAAPASGGAVGAAVGSLAGPVGAIGGAAVGAMTGDMLEENASLRSGDTIGDGALAAEYDRWKGRAVVAEGAVDSAMAGKAWVLKWKRWLIWGGIGYIVFLRRQWIWKTITRRGVQSRFWTFIHALVSGDKTRELAVGFDPLPKNLPTEADKEVIVARLEKSA